MSLDFRVFEEWPITTQDNNLTNQSEAKANMCFLHYRRENVCKHVKFAFQNRLGQPYSWEEIYRFCFLLLCIWGQFPRTSPPPPPRGCLYLEGWFNRGFFALRVWGAYNRRDLYMEGLIFVILRYMKKTVDVFESVGKLFMSVCKMPKSAYRCVLWLWKSRDNIFQWQGYERVPC